MRVREFLEELAGALRRQGAPARHRPAAVLRGGGPRRRARRARRAGRRDAARSSTSASPAPTPPTATPPSSSSIRTRSSSSSTTSCKLDLPARQSQEAGGRLAVDAADGPGLRSADRADARAVGDLRAGAAALRRAAARRRPPRKIDPDVSVLVLVHPKNLSPGDRSSPSTSSRCAAGTSWCSSIRWPRPTTPGPTRSNPMAAMGADKSSHLEHAAHRLGRAVRSAPGGRRPRPRAIGLDAPGRAAGRAPRRPRPRQGAASPPTT